jgi:hypothetical protein
MVNAVLFGIVSLSQDLVGMALVLLQVLYRAHLLMPFGELKQQ